MTTCLKSKNVKILKPRICFACQRKFPVGSKMNYYVGIFDGDFQTSYSCPACVEIMNAFESPDGYEEGFVKEMLEKDQTPEQYVEKMKSEAIGFSEAMFSRIVIMDGGNQLSFIPLKEFDNRDTER